MRRAILLVAGYLLYRFVGTVTAISSSFCRLILAMALNPIVNWLAERRIRAGSRRRRRAGSSGAADSRGAGDRAPMVAGEQFVRDAPDTGQPRSPASSALSSVSPRSASG